MPNYLYSFAAFYFFYFAFVGVMSPYWGPYLASIGFSAWQVGVLMALQPLSRLVAPYLWGWFADRFGRHYFLVLWAACLSAVSVSVTIFRNDFNSLFISLLIAEFFWAASLPIVELRAHRYSRRLTGGYPRLRSWGSYGFLWVTIFCGVLIEHQGLSLTPILMFISLACLMIAAFYLPKQHVTIKKNIEKSNAYNLNSMRNMFTFTHIRMLFFCMFCMGFAHGPYYAFFSVGLDELGYGAQSIGLLWALGVAAEILLFKHVHRLRARAEQLLFWSVCAACVRFVLIGFFAQFTGVMIVAQCLHAGTFALHHVACQHLLIAYFPNALQARAQALYTMIAFGMGGTLGGLLAGALWEFGQMAAAFLPSVLLTLLATIGVWRELVMKNNVLNQ